MRLFLIFTAIYMIEQLFRPRVCEKTKIIYFDLDGVLAKWNVSASLAEINDPFSGYFRHCRRQINVGLAAFLLWMAGYDVQFLSKAPSEQAGRDKKIWLRRWIILAFIPAIIVPYEESKNDYVSEEGILVDDFSQNLSEWKGVSVKFYNSINGHGGTVYDHSISYRQSAVSMTMYLARLAKM